MIPAVAHEQHAPRDQTPWQFRTRSLLWLTFSAAMVLAYARVFGERATQVIALTPLLGVGIGAGVGAFTHRIAAAIYWSIIGGLAGAICVVAAPVGDLTLLFWPVVGAVAGGTAGSARSPATWVLMLVAAIAGGAVAGVFYLMGGARNEFFVDLLLAPLVAAGLALVVRLVDWLHRLHRASRDAWAAGLLFAVIAANLWTALLAGRL
jgi:hypothetical protein